MTNEETLISGGVTAHLLAVALGCDQNWEGVLNDFRQDRRDFGCAPLMPVARAKRGLRAATPCYRPADVRNFVDAVRTLHGCERPFRFTIQKFVIENDDPDGYWFTKTATPAPSAKVSP